MSQHCRANPCCGDVPCSGVPIPQHESGLPRANEREPKQEVADQKKRDFAEILADTKIACQEIESAMLDAANLLADRLKAMESDMSALDEAEAAAWVAYFEKAMNQAQARVSAVLESSL